MAVTSYFPSLNTDQIQQLEALFPLYEEWNKKINVVSRKDIDQLNERHILHSLAIAKCMKFNDDAHIIDLGTGGGFPGVPLAIFFPNVQFTLIDGTRKKLQVIEAVKESLGLENVQTQHVRAEDYKGKKADFVVTRAVAGVDKLIPWSRKLLTTKHQHALPNGIFALKGGDPKKEVKLMSKKDYYEIYPLGEWFKEAFFEEKYLLYIQI